MNTLLFLSLLSILPFSILGQLQVEFDPPDAFTVQCNVLGIIWTSGTPPYNCTITDTETGAWVFDLIDEDGSTDYFGWTVNGVPAGKNVTISVEDAAGDSVIISREVHAFDGVDEYNACRTMYIGESRTTSHLGSIPATQSLTSTSESTLNMPTGLSSTTEDVDESLDAGYISARIGTGAAVVVLLPTVLLFTF